MTNTQTPRHARPLNRKEIRAQQRAAKIDGAVQVANAIRLEAALRHHDAQATR